MSQETLKWLQDNVRVNAKHRTAWWHDGSDASNAAHFDGPVPIEEVRKLFSWEPVAGSLTTMIEVNGERVPVVDPDRQVIVRPDTLDVMGVFKSGYKIHSYQTWLTQQLQNLVQRSGDELGVASVGLLRKGAVAWLTVELPDTMESDGLQFRPFITAATSCDGSLATTYNSGVSLPICDNTLSAALNDRTARRIKFKHSEFSLDRLSEVPDALGLLYKTGQAFGEQAHALMSTEVTDDQFRAVLDIAVPMPEAKVTKGGGPGKSYTMAENKRDELTRLYYKDARVSDFSGSAFGIVQAFNTYTHWSGIVRGANRTERNIEREVTGKIDDLDQSTLNAINEVLDRGDLIMA